MKTCLNVASIIASHSLIYLAHDLFNLEAKIFQEIKIDICFICIPE